MNNRYLIPPSLKYPLEESEFPGDLNLREIREQGEKNKLPEVSFYQALVIAALEQRNYFVVETLRYAKQYGQLEPQEDEVEEATPVEEEVKETEEYPELRELPPPTEQPRTKFSKTYSDDQYAS